MAKKKTAEKEVKPRYCKECGCKLRAGNTDTICSPCQRAAIMKEFGSNFIGLYFDDEPPRSNL
ncbi:hypothetical protein GF391_01320 [Candidatus Uhrbacteria bacterium]|nr:hypothetical protein [Candidatus Uhrbacteria bacterium]